MSRLAHEASHPAANQFIPAPIPLHSGDLSSRRNARSSAREPGPRCGWLGVPVAKESREDVWQGSSGPDRSLDPPRAPSFQSAISV